LQTRQRLLDATQAMLDQQSVRDVSVVEIARKAGTSPATFYQYFKDVIEATLVLASQAAEEMPALVELADGPWDGRPGLGTARGLVEAFLEHWDAHRSVLLVRNLLADEGDRRFRSVRRRAHTDLLDRLAGHIEAAQKAGRVDRAIHPHAAAAAMGAILERLSAYHREIEPLGITREKLVETCSHILLQTVTGRTP
jgi:AcrR family transcriptional regulator